MLDTLDWKDEIEIDASQVELWRMNPSDPDRSYVNLVPVAEGIALVTPDGRAVLISATRSQGAPAREG